MAFLISLFRVGAVVLFTVAVGWILTGALFPSDRHYRAERLGWAYALGCGMLIAFVPASLGLGVRPGWTGFVALAVAMVAASLPGRGKPEVEPPLPEVSVGAQERTVRLLLSLLVILGVAVYSLRALTEPMWANDYIAIWGLKGRTIFGAVGFPDRLMGLEFAHPEYPLGLPLLYAGIAFLTGRWDDHAMGLLFPLFQIATLLVLIGWLRRRGASATVSGLAAAVVAWFEPLYSGFLTGMAEVPLSFGALLFATALADVLDGSDAKATRRLVFASALITATKNEGLFLAVAGFAIGLAVGSRERRLRAALAVLPAALLVRALHLPWRGNLPLADFDFHLWSSERAWDSLLAAGRILRPATWVGAGLAAFLILLSGRSAAGARLLFLCAAAITAYVVVPAFAIRGPEWLVQTTFLRTTAALAPLVAAGIAVRFSGASSGSGTGPRASEASPSRPPLSTPAS